MGASIHFFEMMLLFFADVESELHSWSDAGLNMPSRKSAACIGMINNEIVYQFGGVSDMYVADTSIIKLNLSETHPRWQTLSLTIPSSNLICTRTCSTIIQDRYIYIFTLYSNLLTGDKLNDDWYIFDALTETWQSLAKPSTYNEMDPGGCIVSDSNQLIYQIGASSMWLYNTSSRLWYPLASPIITQSRPSCIYYKNFEDEGDVIFSIGGMDDAVSSTIYKYMVNINKWEHIDTTGARISRGDADAILAADDKIYVIGGRAGSMLVHAFDCHKNTVVLGPLLDDALSSGLCKSIAFDDHIYVFGGWNNKLSCFCALSGSQKSNILTKAPTLDPTEFPTLFTTESPTLYPTEHRALYSTIDPTVSQHVQMVPNETAGYLAFNLTPISVVGNNESSTTYTIETEAVLTNHNDLWMILLLISLSVLIIIILLRCIGTFVKKRKQTKTVENMVITEVNMTNINKDDILQNKKDIVKVDDSVHNEEGILQESTKTDIGMEMTNKVEWNVCLKNKTPNGDEIVIVDSVHEMQHEGQNDDENEESSSFTANDKNNETVM